MKRKIYILFLIICFIPNTYASFLNDFGTGFGGSGAFPFNGNNNSTIWVQSADLVLDKNIESNSYYKNIKKFDAQKFDDLQKKLNKNKYVSFWLTQGWDESWFDISKIQELVNAGKVPVFMYWYFGDGLNGIPSSTEQNKYFEDNKKVRNFLDKIKGTKLVIMEPEFNKTNIIKDEKTQHNFAQIMSKAIDIVKGVDKNTYISLAMTDTGARGINQNHCIEYNNCSLGDNAEWGKPKIIYDDLLNKLDFISFQEMVGQFSRDPQNRGTWENPIPKGYTDDEIGINFLATRIENFTKYLHKTYNKPIFLPYISIGTAKWNDLNKNNKIDNGEIDKNGWENNASNVYQKLFNKQKILNNNGLFGYSVMSLFDNPSRDINGYQYFMQNEYHLGIIKSSSIDGVDKYTNGDIEYKGNILNTLKVNKNIFDKNEKIKNNIDDFSKKIILSIDRSKNILKNNNIGIEVINDINKVIESKSINELIKSKKDLFDKNDILSIYTKNKINLELNNKLLSKLKNSEKFIKENIKTLIYKKIPKISSYKLLKIQGKLDSLYKNNKINKFNKKTKDLINFLLSDINYELFKRNIN